MERIGSRDRFGEVGPVDYLIGAFQMTAGDIAKMAHKSIKKKINHTHEREEKKMTKIKVGVAGYGVIGTEAGGRRGAAGRYGVGGRCGLGAYTIGTGAERSRICRTGCLMRIRRTNLWKRRESRSPGVLKTW